MSTQEYKISPKRSTHIRSRPDMASSNSFSVPPRPSRTRPELRSPVSPGDGRRQAAERPTASADSLGGVSPPRSQSPERLQRRNARRRRRPQLAGTGMAHGETVTPPHMDSPVARHRQDALRLHSRNTRASKPRLTGRAAIEAGRRCRPTRHPWNSCEWPASARRRARRGEEDTTGQLDFGHCFECGYHIASSAEPEWTAAVRAKCPNCGRPW